MCACYLKRDLHEVAKSAVLYLKHRLHYSHVHISLLLQCYCTVQLTVLTMIWEGMVVVMMIVMMMTTVLTTAMM
jgi:hypothetical protein